MKQKTRPNTSIPTRALVCIMLISSVSAIGALTPFAATPKEAAKPVVKADNTLRRTGPQNQVFRAVQSKTADVPQTTLMVGSTSALEIDQRHYVLPNFQEFLQFPAQGYKLSVRFGGQEAVLTIAKNGLNGDFEIRFSGLKSSDGNVTSVRLVRSGS